MKTISALYTLKQKAKRKKLEREQKRKLQMKQEIENGSKAKKRRRKKKFTNAADSNLVRWLIFQFTVRQRHEFSKYV